MSHVTNVATPTAPWALRDRWDRAGLARSAACGACPHVAGTLDDLGQGGCKDKGVSLSVWWFGTFGTMDFLRFSHHIGNVIIPIDELIFSRGAETTNQLYIYICVVGMII